MSKRDILKEIQERKSRLTVQPSWTIYVDRLVAIMSLLTHMEDSKVEQDTRTEIGRYIPIATIAALEGFFKLWIKELIDKGDPFLSHCGGLEFKVDNESIINMARNQLTLGDFIAHTITINKLSDVDSIFTTLVLGKDSKQRYIDLLRTLHDKAGKKGDFDNDLKKVNLCFDKRHIFAHEIANAESVSPDEVKGYFVATAMFCVYSANYLEKLLEDHVKKSV